MKKGWRIIFGVVLVGVILGGLCCGVGILTGADIDRIVLNLEEHYQLMTYVNSYTAFVTNLFQNIFHL